MAANRGGAGKADDCLDWDIDGWRRIPFFRLRIFAAFVAMAFMGLFNPREGWEFISDAARGNIERQKKMFSSTMFSLSRKRRKG